jgi:predicted nucleic acid-binding protein
MKVVLDTNVVVSGLLQPKGNPAQVLAVALAGAVQVCYDQRVLAEYAEVLARPRFKFDPARVREVLTKLEADGLVVGRDTRARTGPARPRRRALSRRGFGWAGGLSRYRQPVRLSSRAPTGVRGR